MTDTYEYDAFGNKINSSGATPNNYLYRGEQWDPDLDLYYLRARYYNPLTDRFLSRDPKPGHIQKPRTLHKYLYASADGVNRLDPRGKEDLVEEEGEEAEETGAEEEGEKAAADQIDCILNASGDAFDAWSAIQSGDVLGSGMAAVSLAADWETCSGEAEGKGPKGCNKCFAAGTPVHTDHGEVPIEQIEVGDEVESRNAATGKHETMPVSALVPAHQDSLLELRIEGERMPLRPSTSHPFWVRRGDAPPAWIASGQMHVGDSVQSLQGDWRRVVAITPIAVQETVYNFTVAKDHDYFVGETGFLVHNAGGCGCFPDNPFDMNDLLGFPGTQVPDGPYTGRNKWIWNLAKGVQLRFEAHPYFGPGAGPEEVNPHWRLKVPGKKKDFKWMPGEDIPGCK